jgi:pyruvate/oxaloacetate carboxyltransferase
MRKIEITDLSLRDGIQSLLATRVRTEDMLDIVEILDKCGFYSLEVWGGATFDVCLRFLKEDPWERLRKFKERAKNTKLEMLLRGQNVVGYRHYPDDVVEAFVKKAYDNGIEVFRIFDALNDNVDERLYQKAGDLFVQVRKKYKKFDVLPPYPDVGVLLHQIPGGMITNFISQLREQGMEEKLPEVLEEVVRVREDLGYPPLVTPTSQIVGSQAFLNVLHGERYKVVTKEVKDYVKGLYGRPPAPIKEEVLKKVLGDEEPLYHIRPADLLEPELERIREEAIKAGAKSEEDVLSYALFPLVAKEFFEWREKGEPYVPELEEKEEKRENIPVEFVITVHGEQYHVQIAGRGEPTQDGRTFFIRLDGRLEEVLLKTRQGAQSDGGG